MKKLMVMLMVMALLLAGCATVGQKVQDTICGAPDSVVSVADVILGLLKPIAASLVPGTAPFISLVTAENIKTTGCAVVTDLNVMISYIEGINTERALAFKGTKAAPLGIDVRPLKAWAAGKK